MTHPVDSHKVPSTGRSAGSKAAMRSRSWRSICTAKAAINTNAATVSARRTPRRCQAEGAVSPCINEGVSGGAGDTSATGSVGVASACTDSLGSGGGVRTASMAGSGVGATAAGAASVDLSTAVPCKIASSAIGVAASGSSEPTSRFCAASNISPHWPQRTQPSDMRS